MFSRSTPTVIGSARSAEASAVRAFEREARVARRVRDLELVRRRLGGREVPLELEARSGEKAGRAGCRVGCATQEKTSTEPLMAPAVPTRRARLRVRRRLRSDDVRGERGRDHRRDEPRAAARGAPWERAAAVLVRADRDVLGAVVGGGIRPRSARAAGRKATPAAATSRVPAESRDRRSMRAATAVPKIAASTLGFSNGKRACGSLRRTVGRSANASASAIGPRATGMRWRATGARRGFVAGRDVQRAVLVAHGASPRSRPVHEHAVLKRHPSEPDRCLTHAQTLAASSLSAACNVGRRPAGKRAPVDLDERHEPRTEDDVKASSASSTCSRGYAPSSTRYPLPGASSITAARVTPARMPVRATV